MNEPIPVRVTRYRCPHCARSHSAKAGCRKHIARCWHNPAARGCKTCEHFATDYECGEYCHAGVDLSGREACTKCLGQNYVYSGEIFRPRFAAPGPVMVPCPECGGDGAERKPGPITGCEKWEAQS